MAGATKLSSRIFNRNMLSFALLGVASGVPLAVVLTLVQTWFTEAGINLTTVSLIGLTGSPYVWKFLWAPFMDRYTIPILGRRRGWMLVCQGLMFVSIFYLGNLDPLTGLNPIILLSTLISFAGASHDVVIDAYRRDILDDSDLGFGAAVATNSYLIGYRFIGVVFGLWLSDQVSWLITFRVLAGIVAIGVLGTLLAKEPSVTLNPAKNIFEAVVLPFKNFLKRPFALEIMAFIVLYKIGDNVGQHMLTPFYLKMGYSKTEIAFIGKMIGFWATFGGGFLGGYFLLKYKLKSCLLWLGMLQAISTLSFIALVDRTPSQEILGLVVGFENLTSGMGTAAFAALLAKLTNRQYSATQYAFLSSLMAIARTKIPPLVGTSLEFISWNSYFVICTMAAIPGLIMVATRTDKWFSE